MTHSLLKRLVVLMLLPVGYLAGQAETWILGESEMVTPDNTVIQSPTPITSDLPAKETVERTDRGNLDIGLLLSGDDVEMRLDALFWVWRHHKESEFSNDIAYVAAHDENSQVRSLAIWIQGEEHEVKSIVSTSEESSEIDYDNPDEQVRQLLVEDDYKYQQVNEQLDNQPDLLEPLYQLNGKQQQEYIEALVASEEDAAVVALNELIVDPDPKLQHAAIEGLLAKLEMHTGHFSMISQMLEQNVVFLNDDQRVRLGEISQ